MPNMSKFCHRNSIVLIITHACIKLKCERERIPVPAKLHPQLHALSELSTGLAPRSPRALNSNKFSFRPSLRQQFHVVIVSVNKYMGKTQLPC